MIDRNKHRESKTEKTYKEAMGEKQPMSRRRQNVMLNNGGVAAKERAAEKKPIMRAAGGVAKIRHDAATPSGAPKAVPRGKQGRGI